MMANPIDKPWLPNSPDEISQFNITTPFTSPKLLTDTAWLLREEFYFIRIPEHWINIQKQTKGASQSKENEDTTETTLPNLPETAVQILADLQTTNKDIIIPEIPITQNEKVTETINFLYQHYNFKSIPNYLL